MSHILPRFNAAMQRIEDERKIGRILREAQVAEVPSTVARATLPGDNRRLRGIPCVARGVAGVSPGTDPSDVLRQMHVPLHRLGSKRIANPLGRAFSAAELFGAVAEGAADVYASSGRIADSLLMAPDSYYYITGLLLDSPEQGEALDKVLRVRVLSDLHKGQIIVAEANGLRTGDFDAFVEITGR